MSPIRTVPRLRAALTAWLLVLGVWLIGEGSWMYAKAALAQLLLQRAWSFSVAGHERVTPWPWADTWPVARLLVVSQQLELIVLNGAYGRTLAFGPGYVESSAYPGSSGTTILTGHRDTHFRFLKHLKPRDEIALESRTGLRRYRVDGAAVLDARTGYVALAQETDRLILITCYPFDAVTPGGTDRYVVTASAIPTTAETPSLPPP